MYVCIYITSEEVYYFPQCFDTTNFLSRHLDDGLHIYFDFSVPSYFPFDRKLFVCKI